MYVYFTLSLIASQEVSKDPYTFVPIFLILKVDPGPESGFLIIIFPLILFTILIILFVHLLKIIIGPLLSCRRCLSSLLITDYRSTANHHQQPTK